MAASGAEGAETDAVAEPAVDRAAVHGAGSLLDCPSCGSAQVVHVLGDNGGVSLVCTSCGHSWS
jgi:transposase-like protein